MCMENSICLDEMVPLEDHMEEVLVLDVLECWRCMCIYPRLCWNKNANGNSGASYDRKRVQTRLVLETRFFLILSWERSESGATQARLLWVVNSWLSVLLTTNRMRLWQVLKVLCYLLSSVTCSKTSELLIYLLVYLFTYFLTYLLVWQVKNLPVSHTVSMLRCSRLDVLFFEEKPVFWRKTGT
jgi:hypothetical protein